MANITTTDVFPTSKPRTDTPLDKTTRAVWEILDGETERRQIKTAGLRKARLERDAHAPIKATP